MTNPANQIKSIGLLAFAWGYGEQSWPVVMPARPDARLNGAVGQGRSGGVFAPDSHLDNFIVTDHFPPFTGTLPSGQLFRKMTDPAHLSGPELLKL